MAERALLVVGDWHAGGGLQRQLREIVHCWTDREVTVLTWGRGWPSRRTEGPVTIVTMPALQRWSAQEVHPFGAALNTAVSVTGGLVVVALVGVTAALGKRRRPSVLAAGLHPEGSVAVLAAWLWRSRCVLTTWLTGPLGNVARLGGGMGPRLRRLLVRADAVVAETVEAEAELRSAGFPPARVHLVPGGVDLAHFHPPSASEREAARRWAAVGVGEGLIVCCCRLDLRQKRIDLMLEGWTSARPPGWRLLLAGDGPQRATVEAAARRAGAELLGWVDDVRPLLWAADAFVLPTSAETTALGMVEAMATGLPGLVSAVATFAARRPPGVRLIDNTVAAWADAFLLLVAGSAAERARAGGDGRRWVEQVHDVRRTAAAIGALLDGEPAPSSRGPRLRRSKIHPAEDG